MGGKQIIPNVLFGFLFITTPGKIATSLLKQLEKKGYYFFAYFYMLYGIDGEFGKGKTRKENIRAFRIDYGAGSFYFRYKKEGWKSCRFNAISFETLEGLLDFIISKKLVLPDWVYERAMKEIMEISVKQEKMIISDDYYRGFMLAWLCMREELPFYARLHIDKLPPSRERILYFLSSKK